MTLQEKLDAFKADFKAGKPPYNVPPEIHLSVSTEPSANPHGLMAGIAAMIPVSAMACQFALLRLALPIAPSAIPVASFAAD